MLGSAGAKPTLSSYFVRWFLLGAAIGAISGAAAVAFTLSVDLLRTVAFGPMGSSPFPPTLPQFPRMLLFPLIVAAAGLGSGILTLLAPEARGSGIDHVIKSYHEEQGRIRRIVAPVKFAAASIVLGLGGSAGDEGPIAQITAGLSSALSDALSLSPEDRRRIVGMSIGVGIGTIFKTPIGGALLASEILYRRDFESELIFPAFVASAIGYTIYGSVFGFSPLFGFYTAPFSPDRLPLYLILGAVSGLVAIAYVESYNRAEDAFSGLRLPAWSKPALGGAAMGLVALAFPATIGTGVSWTYQLIHGDFAVSTLAMPVLLALLLLVIAKISSTSLMVGSGGSGGVFAPGLLIGAATGAFVGELLMRLLPGLVPSPAPFIIVGMLAVFGAAGKLPISVTVMVVEMTGSLQLLPAELIAVTTAYAISGWRSIYRGQPPTKAQSPAHRGELASEILSSIRVSAIVIGKPPEYLRPDSDVQEAIKFMEDHRIMSAPVVDDSGAFMGIVTLEEVRHLQGAIRGAVHRGTTTVRPTATLEEAASTMRARAASWLPVVERGSRFIGMITMEDIYEAAFWSVGGGGETADG